MKHTKGPWHWHNGNTYNLAGKGSFDILRCSIRPVVTDRDLILLAPTAPHDCEDPECPGAVNKRRLEVAEEMAKQLAAFIEWIQDGALTSSDREMFRRCFEAALSAWEKAGKGE